MTQRGVVTIVFDDGYEAVYKNVLPLLRKLRMRGVFAIPIDGHRVAKTELRAVVPWRDWLEIKKEGHEIASHSVGHPNLTMVDNQSLTEELRQSHELLGASTLVYPGGAVDERVVEEAKKYYSAGRTVHYGIEHLPPREPMRLKSYNFSKNNFSVTKANSLALCAWLRKGWLIETYHMVNERESSMVHEVRRADLEKHLKFLQKIPIEIKTIQEVMNA